MFDIGWSEMAVVALIALVVIGPKELPKAMRSLAKWTRKARSMAREFQSGIDDMVREADLDDARKVIESTKSMDIGKAFEETIDPTGGLRDEAGDLKSAMARKAAEEDSEPDGGDEAEEPSPEDVARNAGTGALGIGHPDDVVPPEPEPEPATAAVDGSGADQSARS